MNNKVGCVIAYRKNHTNFGTSLVGYALLKKLHQLGFDVEVINYIKNLSFRDKISIAYNQLRVVGLKHFLTRFNRTNKNQNYLQGHKVRVEHVEKYKDKKLKPLFKDYFGYAELQEGSKNYYAVIVGSDQVWLPHGLKTKFFNLMFVDENIRKISYASSFGVSKIPSFQKKDTAIYLNRFSYISVREKQGKEIVESISNKKAQVVVDPTLLLTRQEWIEEISHSDSYTTHPYIFCYFLGRNKKAREAANKLKQITGYKIITLRHMDEFIPDDEFFGDEFPYNVDPDGFVKLISEAEYVCTDSFHCTAFSIQFHRKFLSFYRFTSEEKCERNSRIDSLFNLLYIPREHIYQGDIMKINSPIDWETVDNKLEQLRTESINFIIDALK